MDIESLKTKARQWRDEKNGHYKGGMVIVFDGHIAGWTNRLRDPHHWMPGCVAVDESGNAWQSVGGNETEGAQRWEGVNA